jgi:predicted RNA binding protein YcfA (HicA-like mRNA interferase family)
VKVRDLIRLIEDDGWRHVRTRGSHRQYKHAIKKERVTAPGHLETTCILVRQRVFSSKLG